MNAIDHAAIGRVYADNLLGEPAVSRCLHAMAGEIERLRNGASESRETACPHVRGTVTQHCSLNFTLTDEERAAIHLAAEEIDDEYYGTNCKKELAAAATLRSLLSRLS
jgi:hypothetical protein